MRTIDFTSRFKKDFKRAQLSAQGKSLQAELQPVIELLIADSPLPIKNRDHALRGEWQGFRDCHIRPDLVLIYRKYEPSMLELSRIGSHSELFKK
jgi:mRNA interferase YafQ